MANPISTLRILLIPAAALILLLAALLLPRTFRPSNPAANPATEIDVAKSSPPPTHSIPADPTPSSPLKPTLGGDQTANKSAAIIAKLDSGQDAPTGQPFKIGPGGSLVSAPTTRVAWLDELAKLDLKAAAAYAKTILAGFNSPDEWALSLRHVALADSDPSTKRFLEEKLRAMWRHQPWQANPSIGYLEAFDLAVFLGGTRLMPELTDLVRNKDNQAVAHAAYLALDRLVINEPGTALEHLRAHPEALAGRESTRANYFSRADVADATQRRVLEAYLLDPGRSAEELQTFAGLYPSFNYMISHNLLTPTPTPDGAAIARHDRDALQAVRVWSADARFSRLKPHLQTIQTRLTRFVEQAR